MATPGDFKVTLTIRIDKMTRSTTKTGPVSFKASGAPLYGYAKAPLMKPPICRETITESRNGLRLASTMIDAKLEKDIAW